MAVRRFDSAGLTHKVLNQPVDKKGMFEWNPEYSVNIGSIDGQHQNLFRIAAELHSAMSAGRAKGVLSQILDRLVQYTAVHFTYEERLMQSHGYPGLEEHKKEHRALTKQVMDFQADFDAGRAAVTVQLLQFVRQWLRDHIAQSDQRYAPFLRQRKVA